MSAQSANASPSRPTCSSAPPSAIRSTFSRVAIGEVAAHLRGHAGDLALAEVLGLVLEDQRERALQDDVDLFLGRVAMDPAALAGAQDHLVDAEGRHAERAAEGR